MTITYAGSLTLGECVPMAQAATVELDGSVGALLPDVQARVDGLLALSIAPAPSLSDLIANVNALLASLQSLLAAPVPDVSATAAALADLQATLASLTASLGFSANLGGLLGTAGVHYFVYAGAAGDVGAELGGVLSAGLPGGAGPNEQCAGVVILASDSAAITAIQTVLRS